MFDLDDRCFSTLGARCGAAGRWTARFPGGHITRLLIESGHHRVRPKLANTARAKEDLVRRPPTSHQHCPRLGPKRQASVLIWPIPGQAWSMLGNFQSHLVERGATWHIPAKFGRFRTKLGRCPATSGPIWSKSGHAWFEFGPTSADIRPECGRCLAELADVGRNCPKLRHLWPEFGQKLPVPASFRTSSTSTRTKFHDFDRIRPELGNIGPHSKRPELFSSPTSRAQAGASREQMVVPVKGCERAAP